jgi:hypothetical protein
VSGLGKPTPKHNRHPRRRRVERCPDDGKRIYRSQAKARRARVLSSVGLQSEYRCRTGNGWHTTTWPKGVEGS